MKRCLNIILKVSLLLMLTYVLNNCSASYSAAEIGTLRIYESIKRKIINSVESINKYNNPIERISPKWNDSILLVNTAFDKELKSKYVEGLIKQGNYPITNRKDLYHFLKIADSLNNYKYIIVDIVLDSLHHEYNDSLSSLIPRMKNISVANSCKYNMLKQLEKKSGSVDYYISIFSPGFVRFNYGDRDSMSLPLYEYNELYHRSIKNICGLNLLYFDGHSLCQTTSVLTFDILYKSSELSFQDKTMTNARPYKDLGCSFYDKANVVNTNNVNDIDFIKETIKDKIVVIADLFEDRHDTYLGEMPGAIILLNAYHSLVNGKHIIKFSHVLLLFIFYVFIYFLLEYKHSIWIRLKNRFQILNSDLFVMMVSLIGWGTFFNIVALILYGTFNLYYNAWYPTIWFTFVPILNNLFLMLSKKKIL